MTGMAYASPMKSMTPSRHDLPAILRAILPGYPLPHDGTHGLTHWARVLENGLRLCEATGADTEVVTLFAIFHDARRVNEYRDQGQLLAGSSTGLTSVPSVSMYLRAS